MTLYRDMDRQRFQSALTLNRAALGRLASLSGERFGGFAVVLIPMRSMLSASACGEEDAVESLFFRKDFHFNALGYQAVGEMLAAVLLAPDLGLLDVTQGP